MSEFLALDDMGRDAFVKREIINLESSTFLDMFGGALDMLLKPTTTWEGMRLVVEKMMEIGYEWFSITARRRAGFRKSKSSPREIWISYESDNLPLATCIAAGLALGVLEADE